MTKQQLHRLENTMRDRAGNDEEEALMQRVFIERETLLDALRHARQCCNVPECRKPVDAAIEYAEQQVG